MREGALSKRFAGKIYDRLFFFFGIVGRHECTCTVQKIVCLFAHVSCQCAKSGEHLRSRRSSPIWKVLRSACCSSKTDHQEHFTRKGHNDRVYSGFVLSSKVALSRFCRTPTTLQGSSTFFFMVSGDAFSHVGLLFGSPDESAAALHIASGDVQNGFHHMGIPQWLRPCSCLRPLSARAFGMTGMIVQGSRVSAEQKLFLAPLTLPMRFSRRMFFCQHVGVQQENCSDLS